MSDVRSEAWVKAQAMGALFGWLPGYTEPPDGTDEIQYKIKDVSQHDVDVMIISVEPADWFGEQPTRYFTIDVVVRDMAEPS